MSSPSPKPLFPTISPETPQSLPPSPPLHIMTPFPSPIPPSPQTQRTIPPLLPPMISPATDNPQPPVVLSPSPATPLPPPPSSQPSPASTASPLQPVPPAPLPLPIVTSPPPTPKLIPTSPPPKRTPLTPKRPSLPPSEHSPSPATPSPPPATEKPKPTPKETPSTSPSLPITAPSNSPAPVDSIPSPADNSVVTSAPVESIISPTGNSVVKSPPISTSPPAPLSMSSPSPMSSRNGSFPAAVEIQKPRPNTLPGFIVGFIAVGLVVLAVLVIVLACVCYRSRRRRKSHNNVLGQKGSNSLTQLPNPSLQSAPIKSNFLNSILINSEPDLPKTPQSISAPPTLSNGVVFAYDQLAAATDGFSELKVIGEGGFGFVYKGVLPGGKEVAVKRLKIGRGQGEREFQAEVDIISRVHHKHLVSLVGYCITGPERLLVYEFVPNYTLEFHLHGKEQHVMEWTTRLKIAVGSAKGIAYLHEDCNPKIIHRDIKASNILLDFRFDPKVSDFGLAKSFSDTNTHIITHISTRVVGTFGYLAPEYASSGKLTEKSDVYSYGVMLLELITGRPPINSTDPTRNQSLVEWARPLLAQALEEGYFDTLVDPRMQSKYDVVEMTRMVSCAAACVRHSAWLRPRMSQIVHALEGHSSLRDLQEAITPGSSSLDTSSSFNYNFHQHKDLNQFHLTVEDDQNSSTRNWYSGSTSEYGLNPSVSSGEAHQTL